MDYANPPDVERPSLNIVSQTSRHPCSHPKELEVESTGTSPGNIKEKEDVSKAAHLALHLLHYSSSCWHKERTRRLMGF